jgi:NTP pyrophosphatase (non-canonical NTP hydrolase)
MLQDSFDTTVSKEICPICGYTGKIHPNNCNMCCGAREIRRPTINYQSDLGSFQIVDNTTLDRACYVYDSVKVNPLEALQEAQLYWSIYNFPQTTVYEQFMGVVEEVGELSHVLLKRAQGIRQNTHTEEEYKAKIADCVGDVCIFLMNFCSRNGLSLWDCIDKTWREVSKRNWRKYPYNGVNE